MSYSRNLQNVVKGDVLAIKHADVYYSDWELLEVDSVTAHRICLTNGKVFYKSDGQEVSDRSFKYMAVIPSPELIQKIRCKDQQWIELRIKPGFFHGNTESFVN